MIWAWCSEKHKEHDMYWGICVFQFLWTRWKLFVVRSFVEMYFVHVLFCFWFVFICWDLFVVLAPLENDPRYVLFGEKKLCQATTTTNGGMCWGRCPNFWCSEKHEENHLFGGICVLNLLEFADIWCCLLLFASIWCHLPQVVASCWHFLLFAVICYHLLLSAFICCDLILLLLFVAICCNLLLFVTIC